MSDLLLEVWQCTLCSLQRTWGQFTGVAAPSHTRGAMLRCESCGHFSPHKYSGHQRTEKFRDYASEDMRRAAGNNIPLRDWHERHAVDSKLVRHPKAEATQ